MKDCTFELEFTSHVLANGSSHDGKDDHFQRDAAGHIVFQQPWFHSAFSTGIALARLKGIKASDIQVDLTFSAPTEVYSRKYGDHQFRDHEAIMPGTVVKFDAVVADHVTKQMVSAVLEKVGKFVGLSPYGFKLGYGKFNVAKVDVGPSDAAEEA